MRYIAITLTIFLGACSMTPEQQARFQNSWMMYQATKAPPVQYQNPFAGRSTIRTTNCYTMANTINCTSY